MSRDTQWARHRHGVDPCRLRHKLRTQTIRWHYTGRLSYDQALRRLERIDLRARLAGCVW